MSESIRRMTFYLLWDAALRDSEDPNMASVVEWLKYVGWETLFPGHCFDCHNSDVGDAQCDEHYPLSCPPCTTDYIERRKK
ncbi:hypothetical protein N2384_01615 [Bacillus paralicheniformis]|uniref:hypothetical protein n=1 Tax=Bacillus paralicheniformis TaxID=1648923 RepID=UPI0021A55924|nr:hypothetical protein [Bacillus paralicheniformis]UWS61954.1 hypothetical protein N2384_01615 [Bacillus paralicheniformis]